MKVIVIASIGWLALFTAPVLAACPEGMYNCGGKLCCPK